METGREDEDTSVSISDAGELGDSEREIVELKSHSEISAVGAEACKSLQSPSESLLAKSWNRLMISLSFVTGLLNDDSGRIVVHSWCRLFFTSSLNLWSSTASVILMMCMVNGWRNFEYNVLTIG
jgi:hypothetical protein